MFRSISRRAASAVVVSALAAAGVAFSQTPAMAAPPEEVSVYTTDGDPGGMSNWNGDDDDRSAELWNACDHDSDGYRAVTIISWKGWKFEVQDSDGDNGNCNLTDDVNFPEGDTVTVTACLRNGEDGPTKFCDSRKAHA